MNSVFLKNSTLPVTEFRPIGVDFFVCQKIGRKITKITIKKPDALLLDDVVVLKMKFAKETKWYMIDNAMVTKKDTKYVVEADTFQVLEVNEKREQIEQTALKTLKYKYKYFEKKTQLGLTIFEVVEMNNNFKDWKKQRILKYLKRK